MEASGQTTTVASVRARVATVPEFVVFVSFAVVFIAFASTADNFLSSIALSNIASIASINGIFVIGVAILMISGEFDLSVGSTVAVASFVFAMTLESGTNPILALAVALGVAGLLGLVNGLVVTKTGIPSFIVTLGSLLAYRGIAQALGDGRSKSYSGEDPALFTALNGNLGFVNDLSDPSANWRVGILWFVAIALAGALVMTRTTYGNWVQAIGGNRDAALAQGIPINRIIVINFVLTAILAGFAGAVQFASRPSVDPLRGQGWELIAVAAAVIGGVSLRGGVGTVIGAALGILLIQMVEQGLILVSVDVELFQAAIGVILLVAVISNTYLGRR